MIMSSLRGRPIYNKTHHHDEYNVTLYYDSDLASNDTRDLIDRLNKKSSTMAHTKEKEENRRTKNKGRFSDVEFGKLEPLDIMQELLFHKDFGTFSLKTNHLDLNSLTNPSYIQDAKRSSSVLNHTSDNSAAYMRDVYSLESLLFINHLALQMLHGVLDLINNLGP